MVSEWKTLPVADAPLEIIDGDRGVNYPKQEDFGTSGDCLFLNTGNVTTTGFNFADRSFITKEKDVALRKGKLKRHDVVLTTRGTVGNVAIFDDSVHFEDVRINSGMVLLRADQSKLLPRFLFQFVRSPLFKEQVAALTTGSAQPQLPIRDIRRVEIPLPPLAEQKAIASILGALDDKIELNRRMNSTLEGMARALFQSWFVDFDPVRAKLDGRKPEGMDKATAALFPDAFEHTSDGEMVPKGWRVAELSDFGTVKTGKTPSTSISENFGTHIPFLTPSDIDERPFVVVTKRRLSEKGANVVSISRIPKGSLAVSCIGSDLGKTVLIDRDCVTNQQINSIIPKTLSTVEFLFCNLRGRKFELQSIGGGSAVPIINKSDFSKLPLLRPTDRLIDEFHEVTSPLFKKILANLREAETLATLRDTLLPKLLSGELSVASIPKVTK